MITEKYGRDVWEIWVREFQDSGMTQKEWCAGHGLTVRALAYWTKKFRDEAHKMDSPEWLKINAKSENHIAAVSVCSSDMNAHPHPEEFRISRRGLSVFVPFHAEDASILRLLRLLEEV